MCNWNGPSGITSHSFYRTRLTELNRDGCSLRDIQQFSEHHSLQSLQEQLDIDKAEVVSKYRDAWRTEHELLIPRTHSGTGLSSHGRHQQAHEQGFQARPQGTPQGLPRVVLHGNDRRGSHVVKALTTMGGLMNRSKDFRKILIVIGAGVLLWRTQKQNELPQLS